MRNSAAAQDSVDATGNVFLMIRFREAEQYDFVAKILAEILDQYSLTLVRADYRQHHDELWTNVRHCMDSSASGKGDRSPVPARWLVFPPRISVPRNVRGRDS